MNKKKYIIIAFFSAAILFLASALPVLATDDVPPPANDPNKTQCDLSTLPEPVTEKSAFLPDCVYFESASVDLQQKCGCRNVNVFVDLLAKLANWLFGIAGGAALIVFVYGGFVILTAAGGERVKKGKDIIVAAVIGLIIIFTAQVGLKFILKALLTPVTGEEKSSTPFELDASGQIIEPGSKK